MRRQDAVNKLSKLLGKNMGYQVNHKAPDADGRAEIGEQLKELQPKFDLLGEQVAQRRMELLEGDEEYQRLHAEYKTMSKHREKLTGMRWHYKFTAGISNGMFFVVKAQGDSWEEVIAKLTAEKSKT